MKLVVDSCVIVSGLDPKDRFHDRCIPLLRRIDAMQVEVFCPVLVLVEVTCALRRRTNEKVAQAVYEHLAAQEAISWLDLTPAVAQGACALGARAGIRGGDAVILHAAEAMGVPLVTLDEEIRLRAPEGVPVLLPEDVPASSSG